MRAGVILCAVLVALGTSGAGAAEDQADSRLFTEAQTSFQERRLPEAVERFKNLIDRYPRSSLKDLAYFWLSRSHLELGQVTEAEAAVQRLRQEFPGSPLVKRATEILERVRLQQPARGAAPIPVPQAPPPAVATPAPPAPVLPPVAQSAQPASAPPPVSPPASSPPEAGGVAGETFLIIAPKADVNILAKNRDVVGSPGEEVFVSFTLANTGNAKDSFTIETTLSREYEPAFFLDEAGAGRLDQAAKPVTVTTPVGVKQSVPVLLRLRVPQTMMNGERREFWVRAASAADPDTMQALGETLTVAGPALKTEAKAAVDGARPGEPVGYALTISNDGKAEARGVKVHLSYHPGLLFVSATPAPAPGKDERETRTVSWDIEKIEAGGSKKIEGTFKVVADARAGEALVNHGEARLTTSGLLATFTTPPVVVQKVIRVQVEPSSSEELHGTPGDVLVLPFMIRNMGNSAQAFAVTAESKGPPAGVTVSSAHPVGDPARSPLAETPLLGVHEAFGIVVTVKMPSAKTDGERLEVSVAATPKEDASLQSRAVRVLRASVPVIHVSTRRPAQESLPGGVISYALVAVNEGTGPAKTIEIVDRLPAQLEYLSADPPPAERAEGTLTWRLAGLAPKQRRTVVVNVRVKPDLLAAATLRKETRLTYTDLNGNPYE